MSLHVVVVGLLGLVGSGDLFVSRACAFVVSVCVYQVAPRARGSKEVSPQGKIQEIGCLFLNLNTS